MDDIVNNPDDTYSAPKGEHRTKTGAKVYVKGDDFVVVNDKGEVIAVNDKNNPRQQPPEKPTEPQEGNP